MKENTTRRDVLQKSGLALAGATALSGTALADDADPRPEPIAGTVPNDSVQSSIVNPYGSNDSAEAGDWIIHDFGWVIPMPVGEGGVEAARDWVNTTETQVVIDGELVENPEQYWREPHAFEGDDSLTIIPWQYKTPPKSVGEYYFEWQSYLDGEPTFGIFPFGQNYTVENGR